MDSIIQSQVKSSVFSGLAREDTTGLEYGMPANFPPVSQQIFSIPSQPSSFGTTPGNQTGSFLIPRTFYLKRLMIQSDVVLTGVATGSPTTASIDGYPGLRLFNTVDIRARGLTICSNPREWLIARVDNAEDLGEALALKYHTRAFDASGVAVYTSAIVSATDFSIRLYTPVFANFLAEEKPMMNVMNLGFVEQLEVRFTFSPNTLFPTASATIKSVTPTLMCYGWNIQTSYGDLLTSLNFPSGRDLVYLGNNFVLETFTTSSSGTTTCLVNSKNAVYRTHLSIVDTSTELTTVPIYTVTVKVGGVIVYNALPPNVLSQDADRWSAGGLLDLDRTTNHYVKDSCGDVSTAKGRNIPIYWGLVHSRLFNSGGVSTTELSNVQIVLTHTASSSYTVKMVHEYWAPTSILAANGQVVPVETS